jgi:hypothetical protein
VGAVASRAKPPVAVGCRLGVLDDRFGMHNDRMSGQVGPPAEVDVVPEDR